MVELSAELQLFLVQVYGTNRRCGRSNKLQSVEREVTDQPFRRGEGQQGTNMRANVLLLPASRELESHHMNMEEVITSLAGLVNAFRLSYPEASALGVLSHFHMPRHRATT